jgi:hypothetical protein
MSSLPLIYWLRRLDDDGYRGGCWIKGRLLDKEEDARCPGAWEPFRMACIPVKESRICSDTVLLVRPSIPGSSLDIYLTWRTRHLVLLL